MKLRIVVLILSTIIILVSCKSEEPKKEPRQIESKQFVLPPKQEPTNQQIVKQKNIDPKIAAEIVAVIKENIAATEAENKQGVLKTIHKDSPQMHSTLQGLDYVFANFDMKFNLEKVEVIEINGDEAKVYYVQTTTAVAGAGFTPTRTSGIHNLKKENGKWKIFKTDYLTNEPLQ